MGRSPTHEPGPRGRWGRRISRASVAEKVSEVGKLPEGTVTILFTDVEGSTALHTARGDEVAREILGAHEKVVRRLVTAHGGHEIKSLGDGFMVVFASARRAVSCAVSIQRAFADGARPDTRSETRLRI